MFRTSLLILATASIGLSGCSLENFNSNPAVSNISSLSEARALVPLGLTMDQVRAKLGRPNAHRTMNRESTWVYGAATHEMSAAAAFGLRAQRTTSKSVLVTFNSSGRVSRVEYLENGM